MSGDAHQGNPRRRRRQSVQPGSLLSTGRRHGARRRAQIQHRSSSRHRQTRQRDGLNGKAIEADKDYSVAGWASVQEVPAGDLGRPIWDVVAEYLRDKKTVKITELNQPSSSGWKVMRATRLSDHSGNPDQTATILGVIV